MAGGRPARDSAVERGTRRVRPSRAAAAGSGLVVLILIAIVEIAATGSTPSGSGKSAAPGDTLLNTVVSLLIVAVIVGLAVVVYALVRPKDLHWSTPRRRYGLGSLVTFLAFAFALVVYARARDLRLAFDPQQTPLDRVENTPPPPSLDGRSGSDYTFQFAWLPVLAVLALGVIGAAAFVLSARRRRPPRREATLAVELSSAIDVSLDDLRVESDPRRAVIAAYARLERVLAAHGQPRLAADTPEEHLSRVLATLEVDQSAIRRLEDLFVQAKFSQHEIDAQMKEAAIGALERVRDELRAEGSPRAVPTVVPA